MNKLSKDALRWIAQFASQDKSRPSLNAIKAVDLYGKRYLAATDGYALGLLECPNNLNGHFVVKNGELIECADQSLNFPQSVVSLATRYIESAQHDAARTFKKDAYPCWTYYGSETTDQTPAIPDHHLAKVEKYKAQKTVKIGKDYQAVVYNVTVGPKRNPDHAIAIVMPIDQKRV